MPISTKFNNLEFNIYFRCLRSKLNGLTGACDWLTVNVMKLHWTGELTPFVSLKECKRQGQKFILNYVKMRVVIHSYVPTNCVMLVDICLVT